MATYAEKLKSPKWQKKRLKILERDNFKCTLCRDEEMQLHVHHLKYTGAPYEAPDKDLTTLCSDCHSLVHIAKENISYVTKVSKQGENSFLIYTSDLGVSYAELHNNKVIKHGGFVGGSRVLEAIIKHKTKNEKTAK